MLYPEGFIRPGIIEYPKRDIAMLMDVKGNLRLLERWTNY